MIDTTHLHPMIVHFPIALIIVGFLFEILSLFIKKEFFTKASLYLLILGAIGTTAAFFSGNLAGDGIAESGALKNAIETHEEAAKIALAIILSASIIRIAYILLKNKFKSLYWLSFALFLAAVLSVARTGYYGGELVYKHAAGVQLNFNIGSSETGAENSEDD